MYANQCIDVLKNVLETPKKFPEANMDLTKTLIGEIVKCHKFHFEDLAGIRKLINVTAENSSSLKEFIILPYDKVWFDFAKTNAADYSTDGAPFEAFMNLGFYIERQQNEFTVLAFMKILDNYWVPLSHLFTFDPKHLKQIEILKYTQLTTKEKTPFEKSSTEVTPMITKMIGGFIGIIIISCLILSCKNIFLEKIDPPPKLNKARIKRGKTIGYSYNVLSLKVFKPNQNKNEKSEMTETHNRISWCRAHFKIYTRDNPLFGKYVGTWLWHSHLRGQNKDGFADKDYSVESK